MGRIKSCGCVVQERIKDQIGERFGKLLITEKTEKRVKRRVVWKAICDCGSTTEVVVHSKKTRTSCGCDQKLRAKRQYKKPRLLHRTNQTPTYQSWTGAIARTTRDSQGDRSNVWREKGVVVADEWRGKDGFRNFLEHMGERLPGTTLDRFPDRSGNYEPGNCRWATPSQQRRNTDKYEEGYNRAVLIRSDFNDGLTKQDLMSKYGVGIQSLNAILANRSFTIAPGE